MDGFEPSTSPLPRVCSTPELHEQTLERAAGIEPASSAWKAEVLPLNYARMPAEFGGGRRIRTFEARAADLQSAPFDHSGTPPARRQIIDDLSLLSKDFLALPQQRRQLYQLTTYSARSFLNFFVRHTCQLAMFFLPGYWEH